MSERLETELDLLIHAERERHAWLVLADRRRALFQAQPPQHRHNRRNERLADNQVGPAAIVEYSHLHALEREQRCQRRSRGPAADNRDGSLSVSHAGCGFSWASLHTIPLARVGELAWSCYHSS